MSRKYDAPCADCGRLLRGSPTSLPAGRRRCHPCRRLRKSDTKQSRCLSCGEWFAATWYYRTGVPGRTYRVTCSQKCANLYQLHGGRGPCTDCGAPDSRASSTGPRCDPCRAARRVARWQRQNLQRRGGRHSVGLSIEQLGRRDGWRCHICNRKVSTRLKWPHPRSASRDHLIPVSAGGTNEPANLALAHLACNQSRGNGGSVQLLLFGEAVGVVA